MKIISTNKKVLHDYEIQEKYTAGVILQWCEVKSIKWGYVNITNAWVKCYDGKARLEAMDVPLYKKTPLKQIGSYEPKASRQLLLHKKEIAKLTDKTTKTGLTIKVLDIYISNRGYIKLTIGLAKLMKKVDKKQILKEKDVARQTDKELKSMRF